MSKNIIIQEGGTAKQMAVNKLKTTLVAGGTCLWVPEDEVSLGTKTITENGTYTASNDGKYGYSQVTVNVPGGAGGSPGGVGSTIVGTDPVSGEDNAVTVNENGELETTRLPESIAVTTQPTKTEYTDGETLDTTGIVVHAYYADGTDYGAVDNSELSITPSQADLDLVSQETYVGEGITAIRVEYSVATPSYPTVPTSDPIYFCGYALGTSDNNGRPYSPAAFGMAVNYFTRYNNYVYAANESGNRGIFRVSLTDDGWAFSGSGISNVSHGAFGGYGEGYDLIPESTVNPDGVAISALNRAGGTQAITITWPRIIDGKELTATFEISVTPAAQESEGSGGEGGNEGGGGGHSF